MQMIANCQEKLQDPSINMEKKEEMEKAVKGFERLVQNYRHEISTIDLKVTVNKSLQQGEYALLSF